MTMFQVEPFSAIVEEARPLFPLHWEELALDKDKIRLALDFSRYEAMERAGMLHVVTVRAEESTCDRAQRRGRLVGYFIAFLLQHLHYKDAGLMAFTDIYYILPQFRTGGSGTKLLVEVERTLKARGVTKAYLSCKVHEDHSALFERLGWCFSDKSFTKYLGA